MSTASKMAQQKLIRMVATSATFQDGGPYAEALTRIHTGNLNKYIESNEFQRPFCVINQNNQTRRNLVDGSSGTHYQSSGSLFLFFARDVPEYLKDDEHNIDAEMSEWFEAIVEDVMNLSDTDDPEDSEYDFLHIRSSDRSSFGEVDRKYWETLGRFYDAEYSIEWGYED